MTSEQNDDISASTDEHVFAQSEIALFQRLLNTLQSETLGWKVEHRHRALLGAASEFVDAAADLAADHRPGVRVVELGLLAERISLLAFDYQPSE